MTDEEKKKCGRNRYSHCLHVVRESVLEDHGRFGNITRTTTHQECCRCNRKFDVEYGMF